METKRTVITALFAALIVAGSYVTIPIGLIPITLQTLFVLLAGLLGGTRIGLSAVAVYLVLGAIGLPVFSGGVGGFAQFASPTGGFLISWPLAVAVSGLCADAGFRIAGGYRGKHAKTIHVLWLVLGALLFTAIMYTIGLAVLRFRLGLTWSRTLAVGLIPFIPGDIIKMVCALILAELFTAKVRTFPNGSCLKEEDHASESRP